VIQKETGENEELILQYPHNFNSGAAITIEGSATLVSIKNLQEKEKFEFLEFLFNGLQLNLIIGIDHTSSNEKSDPAKHLHTTDFKHNQYVKAISCVSSVLLDYDDDKLVPIYGFGKGSIILIFLLIGVFSSFFFQEVFLSLLQNKGPRTKRANAFHLPGVRNIQKWRALKVYWLHT